MLSIDPCLTQRERYDVYERREKKKKRMIITPAFSLSLALSFEGEKRKQNDLQ